jgi:hypothetical protein
MIPLGEDTDIIKLFRQHCVLKGNSNSNGITNDIFHLNKPSTCLILEPQDWHQMYDFSKDAILMVLASENFDQNDYIFEKYEV